MTESGTGNQKRRETGATGAVRLQKYLAAAGVSSRRSAEKLILNGRVSVGGRRVDKPGTMIVPGKDRVEVDGKEVFPGEKIYLLLNKPRGCITSLSDRFHRPLVRDLLPPELGRVFPVGRLDFDTEGLLLLTNDGEFCHKLIHPRHQVWKTYIANLRDSVGPAAVERLKRGVSIGEGVVAAPARVKVVSPDRRRVKISIREGKKRQIKRMAAAVGNRVLSLKRTKMGSLRLEGLKPGEWRRLSADEVAGLLASARPLPPAKDSRKDGNRV